MKKRERNKKRDRVKRETSRMRSPDSRFESERRRWRADEMQKERAKNGGLKWSLTKRDSVTERINQLPHPLAFQFSLQTPSNSQKKSIIWPPAAGLSMSQHNQIKAQIKPYQAACKKHLTVAQLHRATRGTEPSALALLKHVLLSLYYQFPPLYHFAAPTPKAWSKLPRLGTTTMIVCGVWVLLRGFGAAD